MEAWGCEMDFVANWTLRHLLLLCHMLGKITNVVTSVFVFNAASHHSQHEASHDLSWEKRKPSQVQGLRVWLRADLVQTHL